MRRAFSISAVVFVLFGCDARERACEQEGCGTYHHTTYQSDGSVHAEGSVEVTKAGARRLDRSVGLSFQVHDNGTLDLTEAGEADYTPPSWCTSDAGVDAQGASDEHEDPRCTPGSRPVVRVRAHVALDLPSDEDDYELHEVNASLWYCASDAAELLPVASRDGSIAPGCFEDGKDFVLALREPLEGTLSVLEPPVSLEDLRVEESGHAFHYRIRTRGEATTRVTLDVSAWQKKKVATCGDFY